MYTTIQELLDEVKSKGSVQEKVNCLKLLGNKNPALKLFLKWAYFNTKTPTFKSIPDYKPNMVDITFSYIKLEKALISLKYFFEGPDFVSQDKKRTDKLLTILEEISWLEAPIFEKLVMNEYKDNELPIQIVQTAFPELKEDVN
jgi:hypothetical protein